MSFLLIVYDGQRETSGGAVFDVLGLFSFSLISGRYVAVSLRHIKLQISLAILETIRP